MFDEVTAILLKPGTVAVIPTDTVYGVVARAADQTAVARLYKLKDRENKPGTVIAASIDQLESLGLKRRYLKAIEQYWPGPVSVIIPSGDLGLKYLYQGADGLAVRLPDEPALQGLLRRTGPLMTSSANHPGQPTAITLKQAQDYFGSAVDYYVDGGDLSDRLPSTIIKIVDDAIEVIRQGAVTIAPNS